MSPLKSKASFIEPMLCLSSPYLPEGADWEYELKLDGYRAEAVKTSGKVKLRSRNDKDFVSRYPLIAQALQKLPDGTVIDGEIVAFDQSGRPSFNTLQNYGSSRVPIFYYAFDLLILSGRDIRSEPLEKRRELLRTKVLPKLDEPIRYSPTLDSNLSNLIESVRQQKFEGLIAKRRDSLYESGQRSGAWLKMRVNQGQEFVIGGYTPSVKNFDALILGYYEGEKLMYVARTRNGFTPSSRAKLFKTFKGLHTTTCPFANLPEAISGRWGQGLTATKMKECRWLLCRIRHSSHNVECRTMPHRGARPCHDRVQRHFVRHDRWIPTTMNAVRLPESTRGLRTPLGSPTTARHHRIVSLCFENNSRSSVSVSLRVFSFPSGSPAL